MKRVLIGGAGAVLGTLLLSGCGLQALFTPENLPQPGPDDTTAVVVVFANHANVPAPQFSDANLELVASALSYGGQIGLVQIDGKPDILDSRRVKLETPGGTAAGNHALTKRNLRRIEQAMIEPANDPGANPWDALAKAGDLVRSSQGQQPTIVFITSGLGDSGVFDTTSPGVLEATPKEVVDQLTARGQLLGLEGITVVLSGIGSTFDPQVPLPPEVKANLVDVWSAVIAASGAEVVVDSTPRSGESVGSSLIVRTSPVVKVPSLTFPTTSCEDVEHVFDGRSGIRFVGDETSFVYAESAQDTLEPIAAWLTEDPNRTAHILGTTARALSKKYQIDLGLRRAGAVASHLKNRGVLDAQISTSSKGSYFAGYVPDQAPGGGLLPGPASENRSIRIVLKNPC